MSLPVKKHRIPLLLGKELDTQVKHYIEVVHEGGEVINTAITIPTATAIVRKADRNFLTENGGPITVMSNWAKSIPYMMNFVKRRESSTAKMTVASFKAVKEQFCPGCQCSSGNGLSLQMGPDRNQHCQRYQQWMLKDDNELRSWASAANT